MYYRQVSYTGSDPWFRKNTYCALRSRFLYINSCHVYTVFLIIITNSYNCNPERHSSNVKT
jgi:hypothetical protein